MSAKQISTASEEVPFSTSDESEHNLDPSPIEFAKYPPGAQTLNLNCWVLRGVKNSLKFDLTFHFF